MTPGSGQFIFVIVPDPGSREKEEAWSGSHKYGSIRTYIPLAKIAAIDLFAGAPYTRMSIHLVGGEQIDLDFAAEQEPDLRRLVAMQAAG